MNSYNKYFPSLKDKERSPTKLVRNNESFLQLESSNIILTALLFNFASSFWAAKGAKHFSVCVKTLKADLQLIEPAYAVTAKLAAQVKAHAKCAMLDIISLGVFGAIYCCIIYTVGPTNCIIYIAIENFRYGNIVSVHELISHCLF